MKLQGRGEVWLHVRTALGLPGPGFFVGCADVLDLGLAEDTWSHFEKCTSANAEDARGTRSRTGNVALTITEWTKENLMLMVNGLGIPAGTAGTVTAEAAPAGIVAGQGTILGGATPHQAITTLVVTDSAATPVTLVANTNYSLDPVRGFIKWIDVTGFTQPFKFAYGFTNAEGVSLFTAGTKEYWLRWNGLNMQDNDEEQIADLFRVRFQPTSRISLLPDEFAPFEISGALLADTLKPSSGSLGQFGRIIGAV